MHLCECGNKARIFDKKFLCRSCYKKQTNPYVVRPIPKKRKAPSFIPTIPKLSKDDIKTAENLKSRKKQKTQLYLLQSLPLTTYSSHPLYPSFLQQNMATQNGLCCVKNCLMMGNYQIKQKRYCCSYILNR